MIRQTLLYIGLVLMVLTKAESFEEFKKRLADMSYEERLEYEHNASENYISRFGEGPNKLRLCTNVYMNYTAE